MLDNKDGFGGSPAANSSPKGRSLSKQKRSLEGGSQMGLLNQSLSPTRQAAHKQVGGRILQENEVKLAQVLDENHALQKLYNQKVAEKDRI